MFNRYRKEEKELSLREKVIREIEEQIIFIDEKELEELKRRLEKVFN